jgi:hypothetical protein
VHPWLIECRTAEKADDRFGPSFEYGSVSACMPLLTGDTTRFHSP